MTFLRRYGYSAVGFNFLLSAVAIQWFTIVHAIIKAILHYDVASTGGLWSKWGGEGGRRCRRTGAWRSRWTRWR